MDDRMETVVAGVATSQSASLSATAQYCASVCPQIFTMIFVSCCRRNGRSCSMGGIATFEDALEGQPSFLHIRAGDVQLQHVHITVCQPLRNRAILRQRRTCFP